jgi:methionine aminopeptidase
MLVAVEPMIATGTTETRTKGREWPIWTADGSLAVHYEADVLVTEQGPRNLTEGLFALPDVIAG